MKQQVHMTKTKIINKIKSNLPGWKLVLIYGGLYLLLYSIYNVIILKLDILILNIITFSTITIIKIIIYYFNCVKLQIKINDLKSKVNLTNNVKELRKLKNKNYNDLINQCHNNQEVLKCNEIFINIMQKIETISSESRTMSVVHK
jgi:hypothetical protein